MYYSKQRQLNEIIPDNKSLGLQDVISVDQNAIIEDIKVRVNIAHPYTGDLSVKLKSPKGKAITLLKKTNRKGKNFDKTFTANELSSLIGKSSKGKWNLQVVDSNARLCSPSGKKVKLFKDEKSKKRNLKKSFSTSDLKAFVGEKTNGNWTLEVKDLKKNNYGMLKKWSIDIQA